MIEYKKLKHSKDGMPAWDGLIPLALSVIIEHKVLRHREYRKLIREAILNFPTELKNKWHEKNSMYEIEFRSGFAFSILHLSGIIDKDGKTYKATEFSKETFKNYGYELDEKAVKSFPKYVEHTKRRNQLKINKSEKVKNIFDYQYGASDIYEDLEGYMQTARNEVAIELLERILKEDFIFFEKLVLELLIAMGYTKDGGEGYVTKPTNDGGIDGILNADPLGTSTVYYQAKRYDGGPVSRSEIDAFYGALVRNSSNKGVFITTSTFSKGAKEAADKFSIIVIDGVKLTELMITYGVGVRIKKTYKIYSIDEDFFDNL